MAADSMGLMGMGGAAGAGDAIADIQNQRLRAIALAQQDALVRVKAQEQADAVQARVELGRQVEQDRNDARTALEQDRQDRIATNAFLMNPAGATLAPDLATRAQQLGFPVTQTPGTPVQQTSGFMPLPTAPPTGPGLQSMSLRPIDDSAPGTATGPFTFRPIDNSASPTPPSAFTFRSIGDASPPTGPSIPAGVTQTTTDPTSPLAVPPHFTRGATQADLEKQTADALAARREDDAMQRAQDANDLKTYLADITEKVRTGQLNNQEAMLGIRERLAAVAEQNAATKAAKGITLSPQGRASRAAIEQAAPLTDDAMHLMEQQFPGIDTNPGQYNTGFDKLKSLYGAGKYTLGFDDPNDPRRQIVSLLQPVQAGQYMRSSRSRQMLELTLRHMADMTQTPAAQYDRLKQFRGLMPEMLEGVVRAETPIDPANPLAGSYFDPARTATPAGPSAGSGRVGRYNPATGQVEYR